MANEFKVKKGLIVDGSNTVLDIQGTQGQLFSVTDSLTGDLFSVSDISGVPILNVNSSGVIDIDGYINVDGYINLSGTTNGYYIGGSGGGKATNELRIGSTTATNTVALELYHSANPVSLGVSYSGGAGLAFIESAHGSYDVNTHMLFKPGGTETWRIGSHGTASNSVFLIKPASNTYDFHVTNASGTPIITADSGTLATIFGGGVTVDGTLTHKRTQGTVTESALSASATASALLTTNYTYTGANGNGTYARQDYLNLAGSGGSFQNVAGYQMMTSVSSTGTSTAVKNIMSRVHTTSAGDINNVANFVTHNEFGGTGNVGNWAGLAIADLGGGFDNSQTVTNTYGIKIGDITHGTQTNAPYAIYTGAERSQISHNVLTTTGSHGRRYYISTTL